MSRRVNDPWETAIQPRLVEIAAWARAGLVDAQIAKNLGIGARTLYVYKKTQETLQQALAEGRKADAEVENALYKRAMGYTYNEITQEPDARGQMKVTKVVKKEVEPNVTAQIYWLNNRKPKQWRGRGTQEDGSEDTLKKLDDVLAKIDEGMQQP